MYLHVLLKYWCNQNRNARGLFSFYIGSQLFFLSNFSPFFPVFRIWDIFFGTDPDPDPWIRTSDLTDPDPGLFVNNLQDPNKK